MGGFFGVAAKENCIFDLFFGTDYHSHLGTRRAGMAVYGENGFRKSIHNIEGTPFRTKFDHELDGLDGNMELDVFLILRHSQYLSVRIMEHLLLPQSAKSTILKNL